MRVSKPEANQTDKYQMKQATGLSNYPHYQKYVYYALSIYTTLGTT